MRNFFYFVFLLNFSTFLFSNESSQKEWINNLISAEFYVKSKEYSRAICEYSEAIEKLKVSNSEKLFLYYERGRVYGLSGKYVEALEDFTFIVDHANVNSSDFVKALWGRSACYSALNDSENFERDLRLIKESDYYPKVESNKNTIIVRNFDFSRVPINLKKRYMKIMVEIGVCDSEQDIVFTHSGVCIIKKSNKLRCNRYPQNSREGDYNTDCDYWCDKVAAISNAMCGRYFPNPWCLGVCVSVVEVLKDACHWCCKDDGFYKKCVKPFEDFISKIPCDPQFD